MYLQCCSMAQNFRYMRYRQILHLYQKYIIAICLHVAGTVPSVMYCITQTHQIKDLNNIGTFVIIFWQVPIYVNAILFCQMY
jgi:hypothetical protein